MRRQAWIATIILGISVSTFAAGQTRDENAMRCALAGNNPDLAIGACTALIRAGQATDTELSPAFFARAAAYDAQQQYDRAIPDYGQAIRLDPNHAASAYSARGLDYFRRGDSARAIQDFDEAIRLDPNFAEAFSRRGAAYGGENENDRAISDFDQAIRIDPTYAAPFNNRGIAYLNKQDCVHAVQDFRRAVQLNPLSSVPAAAAACAAAPGN